MLVEICGWLIFDGDYIVEYGLFVVDDILWCKVVECLFVE